MNKNIKKAFEKGKAFIPFITCGDPSLAVTERIVYAMEEAGATWNSIFRFVRKLLYQWFS